MKKLHYFFFLTAILVSTLVYSQNNPLVGKWLTIDGGDSIVLELTNDGIFYLTASDERDTIGGINKYTDDFGDGEDSVFLDHRYIINTAIFPHRLALEAFYSNTDSICFIIPTIFEFKENNTLRMVLYDEGIYSEDDDDIDKLLKEFYAEAKFDDDYFEVITFKLLK